MKSKLSVISNLNYSVKSVESEWIHRTHEDFKTSDHFFRCEPNFYFSNPKNLLSNNNVIFWSTVKCGSVLMELRKKSRALSKIYKNKNAVSLRRGITIQA